MQPTTPAAKTLRQYLAAIAAQLAQRPDCSSDTLLIVADAAEEAAAELVLSANALAAADFDWLAAHLRNLAPGFAARPLPEPGLPTLLPMLQRAEAGE